ncbi:glycosyltransferase family 2 protein [Cerasicoccus maritimus]|uniref:glycosyltransferase family 2 protein n=1 Tax=Cerasicoccus maritimus TaxID=490089 RepID=UPI00285286AF|nr:glycosyltransferase family 2 protein [Cerasicoccus maritimus]
MTSPLTDIQPLKSSQSWPFNCAVGQRLNDKPEVSVIIPSFNQAAYLEAAIRSVLCQDYPAIECLVLDGGSKDGSCEIIKHYESALAFSRSHPDNGQAAAVNEGASKARGKYVSFLNSDDLLVPGAIQKIVEAFERNPEVRLVHGHRILIDSHDHVAGWTSCTPFNPQHTIYTINSETAFWRREVFEEIGGFNESLRFALDLDFFCRIYTRHPVLLINEFLGFYRFHPESKSETLSDVCQTESRQCWREIFKTEFPVINPSKKSFGDQLKHLLLGMRSPSLALLPYLRSKLLR